MAQSLVGETQKGETQKAILVCNDYLRMGPGRSLQKLVERYQSDTEAAPTKRLSTLKEWSTAHNWQERAAAYDAEMERAKDLRRNEVMQAGLALDYERVTELAAIYAKLRDEFDKSGLWYTDTKLSSTGMTVDVEVFNKPLIDSLRGVLDDLAKETGGRKQKTEVSGPGGKPIESKATVTHGIDAESATNIFDILAAVGAIPAALDDAKAKSVDTAPTYQ